MSAAVEYYLKLREQGKNHEDSFAHCLHWYGLSQEELLTALKDRQEKAASEIQYLKDMWKVL